MKTFNEIWQRLLAKHDHLNHPEPFRQTPANLKTLLEQVYEIGVKNGRAQRPMAEPMPDIFKGIFNK